MLNTTNADINSISYSENEDNQFEIKVNVKVLLFFLDHQSAFLPKKPISPILNNAYIKSENNSCNMIVTDLNSSIIQNFKCEVIKEGKLTFQSKVLCDILKRLNSDDDIILKRKNNKLIVLSNISEYELPIIEYSKFPFPTQNTKLENTIKISREKFLFIIEKTFLSMCMSEIKYILNSMRFHNVYKDDVKYIRAVTTDGCRLAMADFECEFNIDINISRKNIIELKKLMSESNSEYVEISFTENEYLFKIDDTTIIAKLSVGNFPNYESVIPKDNKDYIELNIEDLKNALLRVSVIAPEKTVMMKFKKNNVLELYSKDQEKFAKCELKVISLNIKNEFKVTFNAQYILDIISSNNKLNNILFYFNLKNINGPAIVNENKHINYVLMPMHS